MNALSNWLAVDSFPVKAKILKALKLGQKALSKKAKKVKTNLLSRFELTNLRAPQKKSISLSPSPKKKEKKWLAGWNKSCASRQFRYSLTITERRTTMKIKDSISTDYRFTDLTVSIFNSGNCTVTFSTHNLPLSVSISRSEAARFLKKAKRNENSAFWKK